MSQTERVPSTHLSRENPSLALWRPPSYYDATRKDGRLMTKPIIRNAPHVFASALLLVRHEDHAVVDRQSLRRAGIRHIRIVTSGLEAARILSGRQRLNDSLPPPDLALCDEQLADMTGYEFLGMIRSHPALACFPVIMACMSDTPSVRQHTHELACSGIIFRPYTSDGFLNQLARAAAMHPPAELPIASSVPEEALGAFERAIARFSLAQRVSSQSAGQWFREGLLCLRQEQWDGAAVAFQRALKEQTDHGEAAKGLTVALRKRKEEAAHNPETAKRHLTRAQADELAADLAGAGKGQTPAQILERIMQSLPSDDADEQDAARANAWDTPSDTSARLQPVEVAAGPPRFASRSHDDTGDGQPVRQLNLTGGSVMPEGRPAPGGRGSTPSSSGVIMPLPELREPDGTGVLSRFPLLRDAVNVARVTLGLYKKKR